jgi:hypothetical protein
VWRSAAAITLVALLLAGLRPEEGSAVQAGDPPPGCAVGPPPIEPPEPATTPLRFGITAAGQVFSNQPGTPDRPAETLDALERLSGDAPFVVRLNRFFYRDGEEGIRRFTALARRYTRRGFLVSLQLRYGPLPERASPEGFADWVARVVASLGKNLGVVGVEVTNEPNLKTAPDNSDGAHEGVLDALIAGVLAAEGVATERGYEQLEVGFNWFYETGPVEEQEFWGYLAENGGREFAESLDWVGLNAYPGTYDFAATAPGREGEEMLRALNLLRRCYMAMARIPESVPILVKENGFPNGLQRTEGQQAAALEAMVRAVNDYRTIFNVSEYLWFDLRDTASTGITYEARYGLLNDDYSPKEAFDVFRSLIGELGG